MDCAPQYEFFSPHIGVLYGKYDLLDRLHVRSAKCAPRLWPRPASTRRARITVDDVLSQLYERVG